MSDLHVVLQVVLLVVVGLVIALNVAALFSGPIKDMFDAADRRALEREIVEQEQRLADLRDLARRKGNWDE